MIKHLLAFALLVGSTFGVTCPSGGSNTTNFALCKPPHGQQLWDTYINSDLDAIDAALNTLSGGGVTSAATLTLNQLVIGQGTKAVATLGSLGTTTTVLHGNASGPPSFGAVVLSTDVSGNLPVTNLNSGTGATGTSFWRGDGTWGTPAGSGVTSTSPITGTTTIGCASCVTASSPGLGIAHFAGSTQAVTSSLIVAADITSATITSTQLAAGENRRVCAMVFGADNAGSALADADLGPQGRRCFLPYTATVLEVDVAADAGTPNIIVRKNLAGSTSNLLSGALATASSGGIACSNTGGTLGLDAATTCSATLQNTAVTIGSYFEAISGTAGGTAKRMSVFIVFAVNQ